MLRKWQRDCKRKRHFEIQGAFFAGRCTSLPAPELFLQDFVWSGPTPEQLEAAADSLAPGGVIIAMGTWNSVYAVACDLAVQANGSTEGQDVANVQHARASRPRKAARGDSFDSELPLSHTASRTADSASAASTVADSGAVHVRPNFVPAPDVRLDGRLALALTPPQAWLPAPAAVQQPQALPQYASHQVAHIPGRKRARTGLPAAAGTDMQQMSGWQHLHSSASPPNAHQPYQLVPAPNTEYTSVYGNQGPIGVPGPVSAAYAVRAAYSRGGATVNDAAFLQQHIVHYARPGDGLPSVQLHSLPEPHQHGLGSGRYPAAYAQQMYSGGQHASMPQGQWHHAGAAYGAAHNTVHQQAAYMPQPPASKPLYHAPPSVHRP